MSESSKVPEDNDAPRPGPDATVTNLDAAQRLSPGTLVAGRYRVAELLGMGAMGLVYRAHDEELELDVALKILRPEYSRDAKLIERFRRELLLARQVSHPNVVRIHDIGKDGDLLFLTMDFVQGRSLHDILDNEGFDVATAVSVCRQVADGLAAAHDQGIVHRDLKPSNVMVDGDGRALITDFGVARSIHTAGLTGTGIVVGTPNYLAPEQYQGGELDGRCDIYALGVVLYEMLAGSRPFDAGSPAESMAQRMTGLPAKVPALNETPANLRHILRRCLEPEPDRRYATARELAADLEALSRPKRQPPRRRTVALIAGVVLALVGAGVGWKVLGPTDSAPTESAGETESSRALTLAVLPFVDETGQSDLAWLARGVPELIFESLVEDPSIQMVDPQRVFSAMTDLKLDPAAMSPTALAQTAQLFDADRLLVGSVRSDGGALRIDARLVSSATGTATPLSVETRQAEGAPSRAIQALKDSALEQLALPSSATGDLPTSAALPAYSRATELLRRGDSLSARQLLEQAVETDSEFAAAWYRLSQTYEALGLDSEALAAADRAVEILGESVDRLALAARAQQARLSGDPERSQQLLGELVERYPTDLETAVELADAYGAAGRFDEALARLEAIVAEAPNHPQAWYLRAKYSILSGASRLAADDYLVRAMVIQNKLRNRQGQADVLNAFGVAYRQLGELDQAQQSYERAAELRQQLGDERGYATTLRNLAQISVSRGRFAEAETALVAARDKLEELGDEAGIADLYNELGMMEEARGRYDDSLGFFRQALQIRRSLGDQRAIAESLNNIGFASHQLGRVDDATVYWRQALDLFNETGNPQGQISVRHSLGQLQTTQGEWSGANESYLQALELSRQLEWTPAVAASLGFLGQVAHYQGRHAAALDYYDEALELFGQIEDARGLLEFGLARLGLLLDLGETDRVEAGLTALEEPLETVGTTDQAAEHHRLAARLATLQGRLDGAAESLGAAVRSLEEGGGQAVSLRVRLAEAGDDVARLERLSDSAQALGDVKLQLEAGEALLAAHLAAGNEDAARRTYAQLERVLRRTGDYAGSHRIYSLRRRLEAGDGESWATKARQELERVGRGLSPSQQAFLTETSDGP